MKYSESFRELVESRKFNYIGHGNPNAKILIISKEPAIDRNVPEGKILYERDIKCNCEQWLANLDRQDSVSYDTLKESFHSAETDYNPLYPYKGQKCLVNKKLKGNDQPNEGTARTWVAYQKLYDRIAGKPQKGKMDLIDFHKYVFSTDFSDKTAAMSNQTDPVLTHKSIMHRKEMFKSDFFQKFPIVIIPAGHYPKNYGINMEEIFSVRWVGKTDFCGEGKKRKFINVHYNSAHTKLVVHTVQLSRYNNELLDKLGQIVRGFINNDLKKYAIDFLEK